MPEVRYRPPVRWVLLLFLFAGCTDGARSNPNLFLYIVDHSGDAPRGIELRFDEETSRAHPPGSAYAIGEFECVPQVGIGQRQAAVGMLCSDDGASANLRVSVAWRDCERATVEGSLIIDERLLDYWLRCERESDARRRELGIEPTALRTR